MRFRIRTLVIAVAWCALFAACLRLNRPDELFGWAGAAFAIFCLMVPTVVIGGGLLLANVHEAFTGGNRPPPWVIGMKTARGNAPGALPDAPPVQGDRTPVA